MELDFKIIQDKAWKNEFLKSIAFKKMQINGNASYVNHI